MGALFSSVLFAFLFASNSGASEFKKICNIDAAAESLASIKAAVWRDDRKKREFQQPLGVRENQLSKFRWYPSKDGNVYFEREDIGKDFYAPPISSKTCHSSLIEEFELVECKELLKLLYYRDQLVFVAFEEYGAPKIDFIEKSRSQDSVHLLVRTFEKGVTQYFDLLKKPTTIVARICKTESKPID